MRAILSIVMSLAILWSAALVWFVQSMPSHPVPSTLHTDAIVVLTGGQGRVEHGFAMAAEGAAPILFISGVGEHVTLTQMLAAHTTPEVKQHILIRQPEIIFDYLADTTATNADQTAAFVQKRAIQSLRLVTAHYHMPRSMLEFKQLIPNVHIVADPVFPSGYQRDQWWQHENTRRLMFSEFYKYYAVIFRGWLN